MPSVASRVRAYIGYVELIELCLTWILLLSLYAYVSVMVIISRALIEWCIGEPMPVFFYRILEYHSIILISTFATT